MQFSVVRNVFNVMFLLKKMSRAFEQNHSKEDGKKKKNNIDTLKQIENMISYNSIQCVLI